MECKIYKKIDNRAAKFSKCQLCLWRYRHEEHTSLYSHTHTPVDDRSASVHAQAPPQSVCPHAWAPPPVCVPTDRLTKVDWFFDFSGRSRAPKNKSQHIRRSA